MKLLQNFIPGRKSASHARGSKGFAIAPILYLLGLIGVGAGVLFSGYSQILRSNQTMANSLTVKNDLQGTATTLAASSWLSTDQTMLCPPLVGSNSPNVPSVKCSGASSSITVGTSFAGAIAGNLPAPSSGSGATGLTTFVTSSGSPVEVGVFKAGAGVKVLDPWGHYYVYCRWENAIGTSNAIMIISAGANGTLETKCGDTTAQGDDMFVVWTTAVTQNRAAVWQTMTSGTSVTGTQFGATGSQVTIDTTGDITTSGNLTINGAGSATIGTGGLSVTGAANLNGGISTVGGTFSGNISAVNGTFSGTLGVTGGLTTLGALSATTTTLGTSTLSGATITTNATVGGTLGVTGATTLGTTSITGLTVSGTTYHGGLVTTGSSAIQIGTTVVATGSSSPLLTVGKGVGSPAVYPLAIDQFGAVTGSSFTGSLNGSQSGGSVSATTLAASGAATLSSTLAVTGITTLTGQLNGSSAVFSGSVQASSFTGTMTMGSGGVTMSGVLPIANGGTGQSSASAAWAALLAGASANSISGTYLINNSVTASQLSATGVTPGTYSSVTVGADGRVTAGTGSGGLVTSISDGGGDSISVSGSGITYSIGSSTVGNWTSAGLMVGSSKTALDKLDVYGGMAIGTGYAGSSAAPTNGLIVQGNVAIGTTTASGALNVNGSVTATVFNGSGAGLTSIGTSSLSGTVGTGNGGTGTNTVFTQGSVVYAGASGVYNQDNSNFFYDATNHRLGLGTATPTATLTVKGTTAYQFGTDYTTTGSQADVNFGSTSAIRYNGSAAATFYGVIAGVGGQIINLHNASSYVLTLSNLSASETTAANQIITGSGADMTMQANSSVVMQYDGTASKWRVIGGSGNGGTGSGTAGQVAYYQTTGTQVIGTSTVNIVGGQVGVGTATPQALMHVNGTLHLGAVSGSTGTSSGVGIVGGASGQVQFNNGGSGFSGDNNLYWDNSNKFLGIGVATPNSRLSISANASAMAAPTNSSLVQIGNVDGTATGMEINGYAAKGAIYFRRADTTAASPSAVQNNDQIGTIGWQGYGATGYSSGGRAQIAGTAAQNWTDTAQGTYLTFSTTPTGSTTLNERVRIDNAGNVGIGTTTPIALLDVYGGTTQKDATIGNWAGGTYNALYLNGDAATANNYNVLSSAADKDVYFNRPTGNGMHFRMANSDQMVLNSSGNVGIGIAAPVEPLHVHVGSGLNVGMFNSTYPSVGSFNDTFSAWGNLGVNNAIFILSNGYVGIGSTSPAVNLDVAGTARTTGEIQVNGTAVALRQVYGSYGFMHYQDGSNYYMLVTSSGNQFGSYNGLRPFSVNLSSGAVTMSNGATINSGLTTNGAYVDSSIGQTIRDAGGGWVRTYGNTGWYNGTYGGGMFMVDTTWIRTYGGKYLYEDVGFDTGGASGVGCGGGLGGGYTFRVCGSTYSTSTLVTSADTYSNNYYHNSDRRLKDNIKPIAGLEIVDKLNGVTFNWKKDGKFSAGVIAQNVQEVMPEAVNVNDQNHMLSVSYDTLIAPMIEAIKQLHTMIVALEAKFDKLLADIQGHDARITKLEATVTQLQAVNDNNAKEIAAMREEIKAMKSAAPAGNKKP